MLITIERAELSRALGHVSSSLKVGHINNVRIRRRQAITDLVAGKTKAA